MTPEEWQSIAHAMRSRWYRSEIPNDALDTMHRDLGELDAPRVLDAIDALYLRSHPDRPPTGAEIAREWARIRLDPPSLDQAIEAVRLAFDAELRARGAIEGPSAAAARLERESPVLGELARSLGRPQLRLTPTERDRWRHAHNRLIGRELRRVLDDRQAMLRVGA